MWDGILIGVDEIWIKSEGVRRELMSLLKKDIKNRLKTEVVDRRGRLFINNYSENYIPILKKIPGIKFFSPFIKTKSNLEEIKKGVIKILKNWEGSFKIETRRIWKDFPLTSIELNKKLGEYVINNLNLKVNVVNPDKIVYIEIHEDHTYIYDKKIECLGGLPIGGEGKGLVLFSGGIDSSVASILMLKRGLKVDLLFINIGGPIQETLVYKVFEKIKEYSPKSNLFVVDFDVEKIINAREGYRQIIFKGIMYKIAEKVAKEKGYKCIITGESLGQVSTQTLDSLSLLDSLIELSVFRPLIGFNKLEIIELSKKYGLYELSEKIPEICALEKHSTASPKKEIFEKEFEKLKLNLNIKVREPKIVNVEIKIPKTKDLVIVDIKKNPDFKYEKGKKYLLICPSGLTASSLANSLIKKGIEAYALDYKTAKRLGFTN